MFSSNNTTNDNTCSYTADQKIMLWLDEDTFLGFNAEMTGYNSETEPQDVSENDISLCDSKNVNLVKVEYFYTIESINENGVRLIIHENDVCMLQYIIEKDFFPYFVVHNEADRKKNKKKKHRYVAYKFYSGDVLEIYPVTNRKNEDEVCGFIMIVNGSYNIYMPVPRFMQLYYCLSHVDMWTVHHNLLLDNKNNEYSPLK